MDILLPGDDFPNRSLLRFHVPKTVDPSPYFLGKEHEPPTLGVGARPFLRVTMKYLPIYIYTASKSSFAVLINAYTTFMAALTYARVRLRLSVTFCWDRHPDRTSWMQGRWYRDQF